MSLLDNFFAALNANRNARIASAEQAQLANETQRLKNAIALQDYAKEDKFHRLLSERMGNIPGAFPSVESEISRAMTLPQGEQDRILKAIENHPFLSQMAGDRTTPRTQYDVLRERNAVIPEIAAQTGMALNPQLDNFLKTLIDQQKTYAPKEQNVMWLSPGSVAFDPNTGQPMYTAPQTEKHGGGYKERKYLKGNSEITEFSNDGGLTWQPLSSAPRHKPESGTVGSHGNPKPSRPMPSSTAKDLTGAAELADSMERFSTGFRPEYAGHTVAGGAVTTAKKVLGDNTGMVNFWQDYQGYVNDVRNDKFGASLTAHEKGEFLKYVITERTDPKIAAQNLSRQKAITDTALARKMRGYATQYDSTAIEEFTGRNIPERSATAPPQNSYTGKSPQKAVLLKNGNVRIGGKEYTPRSDGTVTINGQKFRVR